MAARRTQTARRVVAFTGMPGAGKSIAVDVARKMGVPVVRMGDCVWDAVRERGLELTDANVGRVASEAREAHGPGVWAHRTLERVEKTAGDEVVIDGVRNDTEVDAFRRALGDDFLLVAIHASPHTRRERLLSRGRADDVATPEEFHARDLRELGYGLGRAIALADVMLVNEADVERLRARVRGLLEDPPRKPRV